MDKELLFKPHLTEAVVSIAGIGDMRLRALTRAEAVGIREECTDDDGVVDTTQFEFTVLATSLVDPELTVDEVTRWAAAAPAGEIERMSATVAELSGLSEHSSAKSVIRPNRSERRTAIRARSRS